LCKLENLKTCLNMKITTLNGYLQVEKQEQKNKSGLIVSPGRYDILKVIAGPEDMVGKSYCAPLGACNNQDGMVFCHVDHVLFEVSGGVEVR
jgi:hypothetical protein